MREKWLNKCLEWKNKWSYKKEELNDENGIDLYYFNLVLSELLSENSCVVATAGSSFYTTCQSLRLKEGSRHIVTNAAEMGCGPALAVGCCLGRDKKDVILVEGDGSLNCSIDEFSCIVANKLPIKIFVLSNNCYLSIRNTMKNMFEGRVFGTSNEDGLFVPNLQEVAHVYGIRYTSCSKHLELEKTIKWVLEQKDAMICNLYCNPNQVIWPGAGFSKDKDGKITPKSLADMSPYLSSEEMDLETIKD